MAQAQGEVARDVCLRPHVDELQPHNGPDGQSSEERSGIGRKHRFRFVGSVAGFRPPVSLEFEQRREPDGRRYDNRRKRHNVRTVDLPMALKYCPNGECVNFQIEVATDITRCRMCAWEMQLVKKQSETTKEDSVSQKRSA